MKIRGLNPTRRQKMSIAAAALDPNAWLVTKQPGGELHLQHRESGEARIISM